MKGYWHRPEETAKTIDADAWLHTGDVATVDEQGFVRIVDRLKDMILVCGFNVYPNEIESVVASLPGVLEVGAIGVPDERSERVTYDRAWLAGELETVSPLRRRPRPSSESELGSAPGSASDAAL